MEFKRKPAIKGDINKKRDKDSCHAFSFRILYIVGMYETSTQYIKGQLPGLTLQELLLLYRDELENEGVGNILLEEEAVQFSNNGFTRGFSSYSRFSTFSKGEIRIAETATEYQVNFSGDMRGQLTMPAIVISAIVIIFIFKTEFDLSVILFVVIAIGLITGAWFINRISNTMTTFPVYFVLLRTRIEQHVYGWS